MPGQLCPAHEPSPCVHLEASGALPPSQREASLPCLPLPPSAARVDGDAAPRGRRRD